MPGSSGLEIVGTLGPASLALASALRDAGMTAIRLNASHLPLEELSRLAAFVCEELTDCPLIVDLQGAKMRLGNFVDKQVVVGERIRFSLSGSGNEIPLPHREVFAAILRGDTLSCDDDRLRFRVLEAGPERLETLALVAGTMSSRKGVNVLEHPIVLEDVSDHDLACIRAVPKTGQVVFAFSFMKDGHEADWIRRRAPGSLVVGKVERHEAVQHVHSIAEAVDALWICRGDLGAQLGQAAMARWVSSYDPRRESCPVLMAGQVLEHLTSHSDPTRAEVCQLFDLVARGYRGFVLSDETAIGVNPVRAVRTLRSLLTAFSTDWIP
jgi:pyruvate kinase